MTHIIANYPSLHCIARFPQTPIRGCLRINVVHRSNPATQFRGGPDVSIATDFVALSQFCLTTLE
jgi:hypothetical protein